MDDIRYGMYSQLTTMTEKYAYFVRETQDRAYAPGNNSNGPGGIQFPGQDQRRNGHLHMHSAVLPAAGL